jgi:Secretion system C-terminal sorting domain
MDNDGTYEYSEVVIIEANIPNDLYVIRNYPNPFNPETNIEFTLPEKQLVSLRIYNTLGEEVTELVNDIKEAGKYSVKFDGSNLSSDVYFYRFETPSFAKSDKMILLK